MNEGGCHCGNVRYTISTDPLWAGHCQCTNCQKFSGTGHASNLLVPAEAFSVSGGMSTYEYDADSGNRMVRYSCSNCASPIYGTTSGNLAVVVVRAGSLDDRTVFDPKAIVYTDSALAWDKQDGDLPGFPKMLQR